MRRCWIRATHPAGFRSGEWAEVLTTVPSPEGTHCYVVRFPDGVTDFWRVEDPSDPYEYAELEPASWKVER